MIESAPPGSNIIHDRSIAVLPFLNLSADAENEYFSDGITEEIINALSKIKGLKVIARTSSFSFKGKAIDIREIGRQLGVRTILEGSVRKAQKQLRITAQLINAEDGSHYWSHNFDRKLDDLFVLQDEVSLLIADQIRENFGHLDIQEQLIEAPTHHIAAYELYLKGRQEQLRWTEEGLTKAAGFFTEAITADPEMVQPYYAIFQVYGLLATWGFLPREEGFQLAGQYFLKGQELNRNLPEYPMSFVSRSFWGEWEFQEAYQHIQQALSLDPHYTDALEAMTELLLAHGYFEQAQAYLKRALEVDPLSANHHYTQANLLYMQGKYATALAYLQTALRLNPELSLAQDLKLMCLIWLRKEAELEPLFDKQEAGRAKLLRHLFRATHQKGIRLEEDMVEALAQAAPQAQLAPFELFLLVQAGEYDRAWDILAALVAEKRGHILNFRVEPFLQVLDAYRPLNKLHPSTLRLPVQSVSVNSSPAPKMAPSEMDQAQVALLKLVDHDKAFLDPALSLRKLAEAIVLHPNKLSYLINERFKQNFNEFINRRRLAHFKEIARDPHQQQLTLLGLAYESGFSSKTAFNTFFKKQEGMSPSNWLKGR